MIVPALNPWGSKDGLEPQRGDLWQVDLTAAFYGLLGLAGDSDLASQEEYLGSGRTMAEYSSVLRPMMADGGQVKLYANSVTLPTLVTNTEVTRRDSRLYNSPGWDAALSQIQINFVHDISKVKSDVGSRSEIFALLSLWQTAVRAGRGSMSSEFALSLDRNFRLTYGFDCSLRFLGGMDIADINPGDNAAVGDDIYISNQGLAQTSVYTIKNMWLSSFGVGPDLSYETAKATQVSATFFADWIVAENSVAKTMTTSRSGPRPSAST